MVDDDNQRYPIGKDSPDRERANPTDRSRDRAIPNMSGRAATAVVEKHHQTRDLHARPMLNVLNSARGRNHLACKLVEKSRQFGATIVGVPRTLRDLASKVTTLLLSCCPNRARDLANAVLVVTAVETYIPSLRSPPITACDCHHSMGMSGVRLFSDNSTPPRSVLVVPSYRR